MAIFRRKNTRGPKKTYRKASVKKTYSNRSLMKGAKLLRDVAILKKMVNAEKKNLTSEIENGAVAQLFGSGATTGTSGHYLFDVTPIPAQGDGYNNRNGNSIKWHSSYYNFMFQRQTGSTSFIGMRMKIQWIKVTGQPYASASDILGKFIKHNPFIDNVQVYDTNSERKPEYFKDFKVLRTQYVYFPENSQNQQSQKVVKSGLKTNFHVKFNNNTNTIATGQVLMLITCDCGNYSGVTTSAFDNVITQQSLTGINFNYYRTDYYYDN